MTPTLFKKIVRIFIFILLFVNGSAEAQLICTDVNPDISAVGNYTQDIDLNNDATPDFRITGAQTGTFSMALVQAQQIGTGNSILCTGGGEALALAAGSIIDGSASTWVQMNSGNQIMALQANTLLVGPWIGATDLYLGLKLILGSNTHYGWARFSFYSPANSYTFKDYAYNSIPNQQILAGQGCGSLAYPVFSINPQMCVGSAATLVANTGTQAATNYIWTSFPNTGVFSPSTTANTSVTFSAAGIYTVMLITVTSNTLGVMQNTVQVGFTPTLTSNSPVCTGKTLSLSTSPGAIAITYAWSGPGGFSSNLQNPGITTSSVNHSGTYSVIVTSAAGCTAMATSSIAVHPLPTLTITPSSSTVCANQGVGVSILASGTSMNYVWSPPNGLSTTSGNSVTALPSSATVYSIVGLSVNGCTAISTASVNVEAPVTFSMVSSGSSLCIHPHNGSNASVTVTLLGGTNYTTSINNTATMAGYSSGMTTVFYAMAPFSNVPVIGTASIMAWNGICYAAYPVTINVIPNPTITLVTPNVAICESTSASLAVTGAANFQWDTSVPGLNTYTGNVVIASPTVTSIYSVYGMQAGCNSASQQATVPVMPKPLLVSSDRTVCIGSAITLTVSGASIYQWSGPNGYASNGQNAVVPASAAPGTRIFSITGTDQSCTAVKTVSLTTSLCTGLNSHAENSFVLFPNPVRNSLTIAASSLQGPATIEIKNLLGKTIFSSSVKFSESDENVVDLSSVSTGVYLVMINTENGTQKAFKILKE